MEKENYGDGEGLTSEMNKVKDQIEKERLERINKTFEQRCIPSIAAHVANHQLLALTRSGGDDDNNGRDKNLLLSRMANPLRHFSGFLNDPNKKTHILDDDDDDKLPTIKLPFVEQLPRSMTYVFTDRNQLMDEGDSVIGKRQSYYVDGDAIEISGEENEDEGDGEENKKEKDEEETNNKEKDEEETNKEKDEEGEEETKKEKYEFSEDADRLIWEIGQKYDLNDLVVQNALTNFLELDYQYILERYTELKLKSEEKVGEAKSIITTFRDSFDRLFCRRCLIFDCHTHEKSSQPEIQHRKKKSNSSEKEVDRIQCSESCYLKVKSVTEADYMEEDNDISLPNKKQKNVVSEMTMWTPVEKDLHLKGVEIFGRNSCLISRNILSGLKTCLEVYNYMREQGPCTIEEHDKTTEEEDDKGKKKKKVYRKTSKFLYGSAKHRKYARYPPALRKSSSGENKLYNQYTPCTCTSTCGDQCICLTSGNCCEKYCGCPKECNNRFGGCNCAKGQCINRQCPCFALNRECDPDLCRSCRPSSGDCALLGQDTSSEQRQCTNMKFLLGQHKKILLARSSTHGWGAFTRDALEKNEYLGEYTGELVSEEEADERGKAYGKLGTSYLFTMNDQFDIDACRKGNKFKFLNHSAKPNCYSKLMTVRGDHRIGIFAGRAIDKGEELFFDYCYGPGQAPWFT